MADTLPEWLTETDDGSYLNVVVSPGSRRNRLVAVYGGAIKIAVTAPPERGKANAAVVSLLAEHLAVPQSSLQVTTGSTGRRKRILIADLAATDIAARLEQALGSEDER